MDIDAHRAQRLFQAIVAQAALDAVLPDNEAYSRAPLPRRLGSRAETDEEWEARKAAKVEGKKLYRRKGKPGETDEEYEARNVAQLVFRRESAQRLRTEARAWLTGDSLDFRRIASFAGYNPQDILERSRRLQAMGWPQLADKSDMALAA